MSGTRQTECDQGSGVMVVQLVPMMMTVVGAKKPPIAIRAAIRILQQRMVKEPIFEAASSRTEELFAATIGTTRGLRLRSSFVHGKTICLGSRKAAMTPPEAPE
jgi:hypothetical protein